MNYPMIFFWFIFEICFLLSRICVGYVEEAVLIYNEGTKVHSSNVELAIQYYQEALRIDPTLPHAHRNLATLYQKRDNYSFHEVVYHYRKAISLAADEEFNASVAINLIDFESRSVDANDKSKLESWMLLLEEILSRSPTSSLILTKLGQLYLLTEDQRKAKELFEESLRHDPKHLLPRIELANWHFRFYQWEVARKHYLLAIETALEVRDGSDSDMYNFFVLYSNVAQTYREESQLKLALQYMTLAQSYTTKSNDQATLSAILSLKFFALQWKQLEEVEEKFVACIVENRQARLNKSRRVSRLDRDLLLDPYTNSLLRYTHAENDMYLNSEKCGESDIYLGDFEILYNDSQHDAYYRNLSSLSSNEKSSRKLRIGYLSYDWRKHPMGLLTSYLVLKHADVDSYCISYGFNDLSEVRQFVSSHCQYFVEANMVTNDKSVAEFLFSNLRLDILIDLTSHTYHNRIMISNYKPAPIVVNYLGFAASTGCVKSFDYIILDKYVAPPELQLAKVYTEKVVYMPHCYQANNMPIDIAPYFLMNATALAEKHLYRRYGRTNVCMLNHVGKIEPIAFQTWMNILHTHPTLDLLFLDVPPDTQATLYQHTSYHGVHSSRVQVLEKLLWRRHLFRIGMVCDFALDAFVYGAHTTAIDTIWMSIPLFSLRSFGLLGNRMPSRVASSIVSNTFSNPHTRRMFDHAAQLVLSDTAKQYEESVNRHVLHSSIGLLQNLIYLATCWGHSVNKEQHRMQLVRSHEAMLDIYILQRNSSLSRRFMRKSGKNSEFLESSRRFHIILLPIDDHANSRNWCEEMVVKLHQSTTQSDYYILDQYLEFFNRTPPSTRAVQAVMHRYLASQPRNTSVRTDSLLFYTSENTFDDDANLSVLSTPLLLHNYYPADNRSVLIDSIVMYVRYQNYSNSVLFSNFSNLLHLSMLDNLKETITIFEQSTIALAKATGMTNIELERCVYDFLLVFVDSLEQSFSQLAELNEVPDDDIDEIYKTCHIYQSNLTMYTLPDYESMKPLELLKFFHSRVTMCHVLTLFPYPLSLTKLPASANKSIATVIRHNRLINSLLRGYHELSDENGNRVTTVFTKPSRQYLADVFFELSYIYMSKLMKDSHHDVSLEQSDQYLHLHLSSVLQYFISIILSVSAVAESQKAPFLYSERQTSTIRGLSHTISLNRKIPVNATSMPALDYGLVGEIIATRLEFHRMKHEYFSDDSSPSVSENSSSPSIAIYCHEYRNVWWPGWGPTSFLSQLSLNASDSNHTGMGGSEEAVAHLAHALSYLGYNVTIYAELSREENNMVTSLYGGHNVRWLHFSLYPSQRSNAFDVFISWRYAASLALSTHSAKRSYLWLHDRLEYFSMGYESLFLMAQGIFVQSESHRQFLAKEIAKGASYDQINSTEYTHALKKAFDVVFVLRNGVYEDECPPDICKRDVVVHNISSSVDAQVSQPGIPLRILNSYAGPRQPSPEFDPSGRKHWNFIYTSSPVRGLEPLLLIWPRIMAAFPRAELHVYYGFSAAYRKQMTAKMGLDGYLDFENKMMRLLNQTNVHYHGPVPHHELALAYHKASFFLYPSIFAETGCIAMMKAMMYGAIPVTSRLVDTALEELGHGFDLGPGRWSGDDRSAAVNQSGWHNSSLTRNTEKFDSLTLPDLKVENAVATWLVEQYWPCLLQVLRADRRALHEHRVSMQEYARKALTWVSSAKTLQSMLESNS